MSSLRGNRAVFIIICVLFLLNYFSWNALYYFSSDLLEVTFIDVGQGDATLIKSPQGHLILIDGGPGSVVLEKLQKEMPFFKRSIDLVILTHPHYDHISGVIEVLARYEVKDIIYTGVREGSATFRRWEELDPEYRTARAGMRVSANDFYIDILYPFENLEGILIPDSNITSVVSRFVFKNHSFLFTGDAYIAQEEELVSAEMDCLESDSLLCRSIVLSSDVLQVGHHGSRTSTSEDFLLAVSPGLAVISCGRDNRYGHPHKETLEMLEKRGISVMRTDKEGDIRIFSSGI